MYVDEYICCYFGAHQKAHEKRSRKTPTPFLLSRSKVWCGGSHWCHDLCGAQRGLLPPFGPRLQRGTWQQLSAEDPAGAGGHRTGTLQTLGTLGAGEMVLFLLEMMKVQKDSEIG